VTKLTSTVEEMKERNTEEAQVIDEHLRHHVMEKLPKRLPESIEK
jgi:hypothetical protein